MVSKSPMQLLREAETHSAAAAEHSNTAYRYAALAVVFSAIAVVSFAYSMWLQNTSQKEQPDLSIRDIKSTVENQRSR
ncbi:MAG: hypothetical protein EYC62_03470 [Alphaproteobacteria bacterium]|nr:MAG: hypothetical protein EYC62_03470 [Alphaproteobacteria bacterium]